MLRTTTAALLALLSATGLAQGDDVKRSIPTLPKGYSKVVFYDDFSLAQGSLPDPNKWQIDLGTQYVVGTAKGPQHWGTGEIQVYTKDIPNIHVTIHETLLITPIRDDAGHWTSARIETKPEFDFACPEGQRMRVEAKIKLGNNAPEISQGIWPAFWLLGGRYRTHMGDWPAIGEIDIMESVNGINTVWHTIHCGKYPGGVCDEPLGYGNPSYAVSRGDWHTISFEVDRTASAESGNQRITWLIDDQLRWSLTEKDLREYQKGTSAKDAADAWKVLTSDKMMILFNVAVGGALPNKIAQTDTPTKETVGGIGASMELDYVAVFASG
ncbi:hypothetical protein E4U42_003945 [Claviceps africana]|uniref:GH16 domain-containing protein n=1 Tax=Claviceps africana TaxID=83212 RepID=A0A8K0J6E0_9HYPO|nr:hypothetical protein E4U42_003945 [Claviceps africana]